MPLAVQRLRLSNSSQVSYTLVGDDGLPVGPAEDLAHLGVSASPNTVQAHAGLQADQRRDRAAGEDRLPAHALNPITRGIRSRNPDRAPARHADAAGMLAMRCLAQYRHQKARKARSAGVANPERRALAREQAEPTKALRQYFRRFCY